MTVAVHASTAPTPGVSRVNAVDLARGLALIGMMLVHLGPPWLGTSPPIGDIVAGGRAAPLFAMLAGVSLTLVHRRDPDGAGSIRATCVRGVVLIALGLCLGSLHDVPILIILAFYGVMIVVALPFRRLPTWALLGLGGTWAVVAPVVLLGLQIARGPYVGDQVQLSGLHDPWSLLGDLVLWGAYPAVVWFAYVLTGLLVGRLDLTRRATSLWLAAGGAVLVVSTLAVGWIAIEAGAFADSSIAGWQQLFAQTGYPGEPATWPELLLVGEHTSRPLNVIGAIGSGLLVIGACGLLPGLPWLRLVVLPVRAAGTMTLTLYTVHVLWTWRIHVGALDDVSSITDPGGYRDWVVQVVVLCAAATLWRRFVGRGPLESVVRLVSVPAAWSPDRTRRNAPV